jgi:hypothetical protein
MPPTVFRSEAHAEHGSTGVDLVIDKPAGAEVGDLLMFYGFFNSGGTVTCSGWTLFGQGNTNFWPGFRIVDGSEGSSFTFHSEGWNKQIGGICCYAHPGSDTNQNTPLNNTSDASTIADTSAATSPLAIYGWFDTPHTLTADDNTTSRIAMPATGPSGYSLVIADEFLHSTVIPSRTATGYVGGDVVSTLEISFGAVNATVGNWAWLG